MASACLGTTPALARSTRGHPHTTHDRVADLGRSCDIVGLGMTEDSDVREILEDHGLLGSLPANGIVVNHGAGDPQAAATLAQRVREQGHEQRVHPPRPVPTQTMSTR
jgi:3-hydroxyisobutyrate dehydrogenase-like beta-hydroxyacid dehydrogenase